MTTNFIAYHQKTSKLLWPLSATFITAVLFLLMASLITPAGDVPQTEPDEVSVSILREKRDESSNYKERTHAKKPTREVTPPPPALPRTKPSAASSDNAISVQLPGIDQSKSLFESNMDRRATPIVRIPPQYPQGPLAKNIEGWVLVEFTITKAGTVTNIQIVDADPKKIFNRATIRAMKRWKYQPKIVNGKAVPQHKMRELFHYQIQNK